MASVLPHWYRMSGLLVASEIVLSGLIEVPAGEAPDMAIHRRAVPASLADATARGPTWDLAQDSFLLRIDGIARFLLTGGSEIAFELEPGGSLEDAAVFLTGSVFGILLHQRRQIVLHASAVRVGDKAVLFCGSSGAGKSTIAAALGQQGYPLFNDDICALSATPDHPRPVVYPDGRKLKLWQDAIEGLGLSARQGFPVRARLGKFYVEPTRSVQEPLPVGAIYALREARPPHLPGIETPNVVDAALIVQKSAYRPVLVQHMGQREHYFRAATAAAGAVGIFRITRPLDYGAMPDVIARLEQHWREIGLLEMAA